MMDWSVSMYLSTVLDGSPIFFCQFSFKWSEVRTWFSCSIFSDFSWLAVRLLHYYWYNYLYTSFLWLSWFSYLSRASFKTATFSFRWELAVYSEGSLYWFWLFLLINELYCNLFFALGGNMLLLSVCTCAGGCSHLLVSLLRQVLNASLWYASASKCFISKGRCELTSIELMTFLSVLLIYDSVLVWYWNLCC